MRYAFSLFAVLLISSQTATAQEVPPPPSFLPDYTRAFTPHHRLVAYFEAVGAASPRVKVVPYGETYEGRPLVLAYISSEANLADLEKIRTDHLAGVSDLAVVWISCSVHGNESSGSEASPQILYDLASAKTGDSLAAYLENTIVILDPSLNPDGYTRYTDDQRRRSTRAPDPDPSTWEHDEPWPGGRTNHYFFDLNRDWVWATQRETRARLAAYRRWQPHIHADLHEMSPNSSYYFAPAAEPFHEYITDFQRDFQTTIGRNHARIFDANGWLYYTREEFDLLYPSYGDTYPIFNGAIGMTYEQGGSGGAGRAFLRNEGDTLTLADRIDHHHATALSTLAVASRRAAELVAGAASFRRDASGTARGEFRSYVFPLASNSPARLRSLTVLLDRHGIAYGTLPRALRLAGVGFGAKAPVREFETQTGDLVVSGKQAQGVLAQVLLDPGTEVPDSLTYDITAWSLPTVLGLNGFASSTAVDELQPFEAPAADSVARVPPDYGFGVRVEALASWAAVAPLLGRGMVSRYASVPTETGRTTVPAGTLWVLARDQPNASFYTACYDSLRGAGAELVPLDGGFVESGPDLGSDYVNRVAAPRVVLIQDEKLDASAFGHVWHFFERVLDYPIHILPWRNLDAAALADVDVVIASDGRLDLKSSGAEALTAWVRGGGRLIAMEGSAENFGKKKGFGLTMVEDKPTLQTGGDSDSTLLTPYAERERTRISRNISGAFVLTRVDTTHPLAFGLGADFFALRTANRPWAYLQEGYNVMVVPETTEVRGFVGRAAREELAQSLTLGVAPVGRGSVVYAADNLAYRGFWQHGMQVLANAVFYR